MPRARSCGGIALVVGILCLPGAVDVAPALAAGPVASALATGPVRGVERIGLVEKGHRVPAPVLARAAAILTYQVNHQLRRFWPGPKIDVEPVAGHVPAAWDLIELVGSRSPPRTGGYHSFGAHGRLLAVVYLQRWGPTTWTVGASHELIEMLEDPLGDSVSFNYLEEVCDPVQFVWYWLHGMYVSDFVTPSWFTDGAAPWDMAGQVHAPRTFARGGEEEYDAAGHWEFIGPGAVMAQYPKPLRLRRMPRDR